MGANKILSIFSTFLYQVQMKFGTKGTHKYSLSDCEFHWNQHRENHTWSVGVHNFYTHFPHLLPDLDDIWYKRYTQSALQMWEFLEKRCMGSCNFPTGINKLTFTQSTRKQTFRVKNVTSENATFVTMIFLK
jgi:hypothetical protein